MSSCSAQWLENRPNSVIMHSDRCCCVLWPVNVQIGVIMHIDWKNVVIVQNEHRFAYGLVTSQSDLQCCIMTAINWSVIVHNGHIVKIDYNTLSLHKMTYLLISHSIKWTDIGPVGNCTQWLPEHKGHHFAQWHTWNLDTAANEQPRTK